MFICGSLARERERGVASGPVVVVLSFQRTVAKVVADLHNGIDSCRMACRRL